MVRRSLRAKSNVPGLKREKCSAARRCRNVVLLELTNGSRLTLTYFYLETRFTALGRILRRLLKMVVVVEKTDVWSGR